MPPFKCMQFTLGKTLSDSTVRRHAISSLTRVFHGLPGGTALQGGPVPPRQVRTGLVRALHKVQYGAPRVA